MGNTTDFESARKRHNFFKTVKRLFVIIIVVAVLVLLYAFRFDIASQGFGVLLSDNIAMLIDQTGYPITIDSQPVQLCSVGSRAVLMTENSMSVYNKAGNRVIEKHIAGENVVAVSAGRFLLTYELGGYDLEIRSGDTVMFSHRFDYPIYCADIAENGAFAAAIGAQGAQAQVIAYDSHYSEQFWWVSAERVIYSLALNSNAEYIAVGGMQLDEGTLDSIVEVFQLSDGSQRAFLTFNDEMLLGLQLLEDGSVSSVTTEGIYVFSPAGKLRNDYTYEGEGIAAFDIAFDGKIAAAIGDYDANHELRVVKLDSNGALLGEAALDRDIESVHIYEDSVLAFVGERAIRFDAEMKKAASTETPEALAVIPVKNQLYYATMHQINRTTIK